MLLRNLSSTDANGSTQLHELSDGIPIIAALARLCGHAIAGETQATAPTNEALAIVAVSGRKGAIEVRGDKNAFESANRFLAVCIELEAERHLLLRDKSNPRKTMLFLDAFRQLCQSGFIIHHNFREFSLSNAGFELADTLNQNEFSELLDFAVEIEH